MNEKKEQTVWIKCRASEACEGNQAVMVFKRQLKGMTDSDHGGQIVRYRCTTCGHSFHINH